MSSEPKDGAAPAWVVVPRKVEGRPDHIAHEEVSISTSQSNLRKFESRVMSFNFVESRMNCRSSRVSLVTVDRSVVDFLRETASLRSVSVWGCCRPRSHRTERGQVMGLNAARARTQCRHCRHRDLTSNPAVRVAREPVRPHERHCSSEPQAGGARHPKANAVSPP